MKESTSARVPSSSPPDTVTPPVADEGEADAEEGSTEDEADGNGDDNNDGEDQDENSDENE